MDVRCVDFSHEPIKKTLPPVTVIQDVRLIDLGNDYATPPLPSAGLRIYDVDSNGQNEFFISQGTVRVIPEWSGAIRVVVGTTHFVSEVGVLTIRAYDCNSNLVDTAMNTIAQEGILEKLILMAPEICYIEIRGQELAIDKICFLID